MPVVGALLAGAWPAVVDGAPPVSLGIADDAEAGAEGVVEAGAEGVVVAGATAELPEVVLLGSVDSLSLLQPDRTAMAAADVKASIAIRALRVEVFTGVVYPRIHQV